MPGDDQTGYHRRRLSVGAVPSSKLGAPKLDWIKFMLIFSALGICKQGGHEMRSLRYSDRPGGFYDVMFTQACGVELCDCHERDERPTA